MPRAGLKRAAPPRPLCPGLSSKAHGAAALPEPRASRGADPGGRLGLRHALWERVPAADDHAGGAWRPSAPDRARRARAGAPGPPPALAAGRRGPAGAPTLLWRRGRRGRAHLPRREPAAREVEEGPPSGEQGAPVSYQPCPPSPRSASNAPETPAGARGLLALALDGPPSLLLSHTARRRRPRRQAAPRALSARPQLARRREPRRRHGPALQPGRPATGLDAQLGPPRKPPESSLPRRRPGRSGGRPERPRA